MVRFFHAMGSFEIIDTEKQQNQIPKIKEDLTMMELSKVNRKFIRKSTKFWSSIFSKSTK